MTDYSRLPEHMQDTARRYIEHRSPGCAFFMAVVRNDLVGAFAEADGVNTAWMPDWAHWLYYEAPCLSWGSPETVEAWLKGGDSTGEYHSAYAHPLSKAKHNWPRYQKGQDQGRSQQRSKTDD